MWMPVARPQLTCELPNGLHPQFLSFNLTISARTSTTAKQIEQQPTAAVPLDLAACTGMWAAPHWSVLLSRVLSDGVWLLRHSHAALMCCSKDRGVLCNADVQ